jgi:hypothetical protein
MGIFDDFSVHSRMIIPSIFPISRRAVISVAGLAIGLAFFALLAAYVRDDLMFDRFHAKADRTYLSFIHVALTAVAFDLTMWPHN